MDSSKIKTILIVIGAMFFAIYLGVAAATANLEAIAWVVGVAGIVIVLALGKHIWILIPILVTLSGGINALPGTPPPWWAAMAVVWTMFILRFARRSQEFIYRWSWLDFAILLQFVALLQAYIRNPTGLAFFGGDTVGGRAYISFAFAIASYAALSIVRTDLRIVRIVVIFAILMAFGDGLLMLSSEYFPSVSAIIIPIYSGVIFSSAAAGAATVEVNQLGETRLTAGKDIGQSLGNAAFTIYPPISTLNPLKVLRFTLMFLAVLFTFLSGFRSIMGWLGAVFAVASFVRGRWLDVAAGAMLGTLALSMMIITDSVRALPYGAQRILSVLPLNVDDTIRENAEDSSEWRFEMWKLALSSDRYISNKLLGDGFGYSAAEQMAATDAAMGDTRRSKGMSVQDIMLSRGSYHGFHVETIRFTGVFGLLCALIGMFIFLRYAWNLIQYFKGRPEWGFVLYICVPFLLHPFWTMLVFGAYRNNFPILLVTAGMLKLLDNIRAVEASTTQVPETSTRERSLVSTRNKHPVQATIKAN